MGNWFQSIWFSRETDGTLYVSVKWGRFGWYFDVWRFSSPFPWKQTKRVRCGKRVGIFVVAELWKYQTDPEFSLAICLFDEKTKPKNKKREKEKKVRKKERKEGRRKYINILRLVTDLFWRFFPVTLSLFDKLLNRNRNQLKLT